MSPVSTHVLTALKAASELALGQRAIGLAVLGLAAWGLDVCVNWLREGLTKFAGCLRGPRYGVERASAEVGWWLYSPDGELVLGRSEEDAVFDQSEGVFGRYSGSQPQRW